MENPVTQDPPFAMIALPPARSAEKPRRTGLTMMADWGLGLHQQEDILSLGGRYVDFAKIVTGTARLYERGYLTDKLALYKAHRVRPFIGGQFFEYVLANQGWQALPAFFDEALATGFDTLEISDNCIPLDDAERVAAVELARRHGLSVMGEVGSKNEANDVDLLIAQAHQFFAAGAECVLVEAAELVEGGKAKPEMLAALREGLDLGRVMIELPGPWISGVTLSLIQDLKKALIAGFGPDVNIANVHAEDLIATEALRVGLGVVGPTERLAG
jgi:phosphosulfolactate synthase